VLSIAVLAGGWPLITALAIRIRKAGMLAQPTGLAFAGWGLAGYVRAVTANSPAITGYLGVLQPRAGLVLSAILLLTGVFVWRIGNRYQKIVRYTDPALLKGRFIGVAWLLTILFIFVASGGFSSMAASTNGIPLRGR
jgi:hypothetical protein